jgi:hypothetical protein
MHEELKDAKEKSSLFPRGSSNAVGGERQRFDRRELKCDFCAENHFATSRTKVGTNAGGFDMFNYAVTCEVFKKYIKEGYPISLDKRTGRIHDLRDLTDIKPWNIMEVREKGGLKRILDDLVLNENTKGNAASGSSHSIVGTTIIITEDQDGLRYEEGYFPNVAQSFTASGGQVEKGRMIPPTEHSSPCFSITYSPTSVCLINNEEMIKVDESTYTSFDKVVTQIKGSDNTPISSTDLFRCYTNFLDAKVLKKGDKIELRSLIETIVNEKKATVMAAERREKSTKDAREATSPYPSSKQVGVPKTEKGAGAAAKEASSPPNPFAIDKILDKMSNEDIMDAISQEKKKYILKSGIETDLDDLMTKLLQQEITLPLIDLLGVKQVREWLQKRLEKKRVYKESNSITGKEGDEEVEGESKLVLGEWSDEATVVAVTNEASGTVMRSPDMEDGWKPKPVTYTTVPTPQLGIVISNGIQIGKVPVDPGSEMTVVSVPFFNAVKLANPNIELDTRTRMIMTVANGGTSQMKGLLRGLEVQIGHLRYKELKAWVCEGAPYDLLLGQPFTRAATMALRSFPEGDMFVELQPQEEGEQPLVVQVVSRFDPKNVVDFRARGSTERVANSGNGNTMASGLENTPSDSGTDAACTTSEPTKVQNEKGKKTVSWMDRLEETREPSKDFWITLLNKKNGGREGCNQ